jgi:hypothetical protein
MGLTTSKSTEKAKAFSTCGEAIHDARSSKAVGLGASPYLPSDLDVGGARLVRMDPNYDEGSEGQAPVTVEEAKATRTSCALLRGVPPSCEDLGGAAAKQRHGRGTFAKAESECARELGARSTSRMLMGFVVLGGALSVYWV